MAHRASYAVTIVLFVGFGIVSVDPASADDAASPTAQPTTTIEFSTAAAARTTVARPGAIVAGADLGPFLDAMRLRSATFRAQWRRLEAAPTFVRIQRTLQLDDRRFQARTVIHRLVDGSIVASVQIGACGDPTEWLAHEIEHILEQLDGVDLNQLARSRKDAWASADRMFETTRAIQAGRTVRREVRERMK